MKKSILLGIIGAFVLGAWGCSDNDSELSEVDGGTGGVENGTGGAAGTGGKQGTGGT